MADEDLKPEGEEPAVDSAPAVDAEAERKRRIAAERESIAERKKRQELETELASRDQWQSELREDPYFRQALKAYNGKMDPTQFEKLVEAALNATTPAQQQRADEALTAGTGGDPQLAREVEALKARLMEVSVREQSRTELEQAKAFCRDYGVVPKSEVAKQLEAARQKLGKPLTYEVLAQLAELKGLKKIDAPDPAVYMGGDDEGFPMERGYSPAYQAAENPLQGLDPRNPRYEKDLIQRAIDNFNAGVGGKRG